MTINKSAGWGVLPLPPVVPPPVDKLVTALAAVTASQRPLADLVLPAGPLGALRDSVDDLRQAVAVNNPNVNLQWVVQALGPDGALVERLDAIALALMPDEEPEPGSPGPAAFTVLWSLGAVRDALCDRGNPSYEAINAQLDAAGATKSFEYVFSWLTGTHGELADRYKAQFERLQDEAGFEEERRERMGELVDFERQVIEEVDEDELPLPTERKSGRAKA
jgi:hypothetical protein